MKRLTLATLALLTLSGVAATASDHDAARWAQVGPWHILVDQTLGNGCFMMSSYPDQGTVFRVGINNINSSSYFLIGNSAWQSLEVGKQYQVGGQFDNGSMDYWTATAVAIGNTTFLSVRFNSPSPSEVLTIFGERLNIKLYYRGNRIANMNLNGTAAAAAETINCNRQFTATRADPFENSTRPVVTDPFHQS